MRELVLTDTAKEDLELIASFLQNKFSNKVKTDFLVKFSEKLLFIENMPLMYPTASKNKRVRRCVIHKNTSCFHEISEKLISVLAIVDNRINPDDSRF